MPKERKYVMDSEVESIRLDLKTDGKSIEKQAIWAGIKPGMRVADLGCGPGKTTYYLNKLVQPKGETIGIDFSQQRIQYANEKYIDFGIKYLCRDIREPLNDLGEFDFCFVRFVVEYYYSESFDIVKNISNIIKPGGILCLIDLDYNCLNHFGLSDKLEKTVLKIMNTLKDTANFDPFAGRKLYSYLYDLDFKEINVDLTPHHLIFGNLDEQDAFNWTKKVEIAAKHSGHKFEEYNGGFEEFFQEFKHFFFSRRRFTYTPLISCRGIK